MPLAMNRSRIVFPRISGDLTTVTPKIKKNKFEVAVRTKAQEGRQ